MEKRNIVAEIAAHLKGLTLLEAVHSPGTFDDILMSVASSAWGWVDPLQFNGRAIVWHQFSPGKKAEAGGVVFDFKPLPSYSVNLWGSTPHTSDDCHTGKDFQSLAEAIEAFEYPELHFLKLAFYDEVHIEIDGPGINNVRVIGTKRPDRADDDWTREQALQNGMAFGVAGYNDTLGY